jgi:hypothetical protein
MSIRTNLHESRRGWWNCWSARGINQAAVDMLSGEGDHRVMRLL